MVTELNYAGFLACSTVNGPGRRAVVWVQGCPLRCSGCFNPELWSFVPRNRIRAGDLADRITALPDIEGVTFSGGEPFCQAAALAEVGELVREQGLTVVTFTGFPFRELRLRQRRSWNALLGATDLLIAGPYRRDLPCSNPLLASANQEIVHLSGLLRGREDEPGQAAGTVEYTISAEGVITTTGFPDRHDSLCRMNTGGC
jgi:anaerobic ribonucleoside-triphosphate reductase activating protein